MFKTNAYVDVVGYDWLLVIPQSLTKQAALVCEESFEAYHPAENKQR